MKTEYQPWICLVILQTDAHTSCLPALFLRFSLVNDSGAQCSACGIQASSNNRNAFRKSGFFCRPGCYPSDDLVAIQNFRKKIHRNPHLPGHVGVPFSGPHIKAVPSVSITDIFRNCPCQPVTDITVGMKNLLRLFKHFRKHFPVPKHLWCGIRRLQGISRQIENLILSDTAVQPVTNFLRARVHPDRGIGQTFSLSVQRNGRPSLPVYSDSGNLFRTDSAAVPYFFQSHANSPVPVLRVLLCPPLMGIKNRVIPCAGCFHIPVCVKYGRFACTGADVDPQQIFRHSFTSFYR